MKVRCEIGVEIPDLPDKKSVEEYLNDCKFCVYDSAHDDICTDVYEYNPVDPIPDDIGNQWKTEKFKELREQLVTNKGCLVDALHPFTSDAFNDKPDLAKVTADGAVTILINEIFNGKPPIKKLSVISFGPSAGAPVKECWAWSKDTAEDLYDFLLDTVNHKLEELENDD